MCLPSTVLTIKTLMGSLTLDATCLRHVRILTTKLNLLMATSEAVEVLFMLTAMQ